MIGLLRKTIRLGVLGGIGYRLWKTVRDRRQSDPWAGSWVSMGDPTSSAPAAAPIPPTPAPSGPGGVTPAPAHPATGGGSNLDGTGTNRPGPTRPATTRATRPSRTGPARKAATGKAEEPPGQRTWVVANDGVCPQSHPVKAKLSSKIFHLPGGRNYNRTHADRCYPDAESAAADGLRPAQR